MEGIFYRIITLLILIVLFAILIISCGDDEDPGRDATVMDAKMEMSADKGSVVDSGLKEVTAGDNGSQD